MHRPLPPEPAADDRVRCHADLQVSCSDCRLARICLPIALGAGEVEQLDAIVQRGRTLRKGELAFRQDGPFHALYAVRSGTLKSYCTDASGAEQITGFYFPGEILGLDGISRNRHPSSAQALETAAICEIPFERLGELSARVPSLQRHFFQLMSQEIAGDRQLIAMLGRHSAEQRVAALLLNIAQRNARHGLSATAFRLSMARAEIGSYLGLTLETVSRVLSRFQKSGAIEVAGREIVLAAPATLRAIVAGVD
jgi:CRP/FNR family transcriptional regulator